MALLGEIGGAAYDVIASRDDGRDVILATGGADAHAVADADGIGGADAADAEVALDAAVDELAVRCAVEMHLEATAEVADHQALLLATTHRLKVMG